MIRGRGHEDTEPRPVRRVLAILLTVVASGGLIVAVVHFRPWDDLIGTEPAEPFEGTRTLEPEARAQLAAAAEDDREGSEALSGEIARELGGGAFEGRSGRTAEGSVRLLEMTDGRRLVLIDDLDVPDGVLLKVYLSPAPADAPSDEFAVNVESLGDLTYNVGDSIYEIPPGTDLARFRSVSIWDERWGVNFAVAPLAPPG
ncbi:MAG: DM13 domain-containing protein [Acidimicrobiia bacterium]|nr:DM13 domain-containing protein [Acidimicrobiia bacterium]